MWRSIFIITLFKICFLRGVVCRGSVLFWLFVQLLTVLLSSKKTSLKSKKYYLSNNHLCPLFKYRPFLKRKKLMSPSVLKKTAQKVLMKMYVVGSIFYQITKVEYSISAKMYSAVHVNYLVQWNPFFIKLKRWNK